MANTCKISEYVVSTLVDASADGSSMGDCAISAGISYPTLKNWLDKGARDNEADEATLYASLYRRFNKSAAKKRREVLRKLANADDWRANLEWLRRTSSEYPNFDRVTEAAIVADTTQGDEIIEHLRGKSNA